MSKLYYKEHIKQIERLKYNILIIYATCLFHSKISLELTFDCYYETIS